MFEMLQNEARDVVLILNSRCPCFGAHVVGLNSVEMVHQTVKLVSSRVMEFGGFQPSELSLDSLIQCGVGSCT